MVEVQVAVRHVGDLVDAHAVLRQGVHEDVSARAVVRVDVGGGAHSRVEEEQPMWMGDEVAEAGHDAW